MKKLVFYVINGLLITALAGCSTVQPKVRPVVPSSEQSNAVQNQPTRNASLSRLKPVSMEFEKIQLKTILAVLSQHTKLKILVDVDVMANSYVLDREIDTRLINVSVDEALSTLLSYDCLSYKMVNPDTIYIYNDKANQCKNGTSDHQLTKPLLDGGKLSMQFASVNFVPPLQILSQHVSTNIVIDKNAVPKQIGLNQINVPAAMLFQRVLETSCLSSRKTGENTVFVYQTDNQKSCQFKALGNGELAVNPTLQQKVSFEADKLPAWGKKPLEYSYYLYEIGEKTNTDLMMKDLDYRVIYLKADNQPAYKVLSALAKANCFNVAELKDKSLVLVNKPETDQCQPIKDGSTIIVE